MLPPIVEAAKKAAAWQVIDENLKVMFKKSEDKSTSIIPGDNCVIGIGSGTTCTYGVQRLADRVKKEKLNVVCIATSYPAKQLILEYDLPLGELEKHPIIDFTFNGADEVDANLNLLKAEGASMLEEKVIATCSKKFFIVADYRKSQQTLGDDWKHGLAIEVVPYAYLPLKQQIEERFGGRVVLRMAFAKYGPLVTDNGNLVLDWHFPNGITDWEKINNELLMIPGVLETGIFLKNIITKAYFAMPDGTVREQVKA